MADYRNGLLLIPEHMHASITMWIEDAQPHPALMGHFLRALLSNDLMQAFAYADGDNLRHMHGWAVFLYNYAPSTCYGSPERVQAWFDEHRADELEAEQNAGADAGASTHAQGHAHQEET